jgi:hypothetical protein
MSLDVDKGCTKDLLPVESGPWFDTEYSCNMCALRQLLIIRIAYGGRCPSEALLSFGIMTVPRGWAQ